MATQLTTPVTRTVTTPHGDVLHITLAPEGIYVREKGRRGALPVVSYGKVFHIAAELGAADRITARRATRRVSRSLV